MSKGYTDDTNPFGNGLPDSLDIHDVDALGFGAVGSGIDIPDNGVVRSKPIALHLIYPDFRQPRRGIPMVVRGKWDGRPEEIEGVLDAFHAFAEAEAGREIDVEAILKGREALVLDDKEKGASTPLFDDYANLIILAQNIENEGLTNPITVVKKGSLYQVETGERRWLAFHLLAKYLDADKYGKIPAREVEYDAFRQASENNARRSLDAIALSRQVCILIMELLDDEHDYYSMQEMIMPGENERRYYAQVANGYVHQVPPALRTKIQKAVRGLSWSALTNYKNLSALTGNDVVDDALWLAADGNKWAEGGLRELKVPKGWDADFAEGYVKDMEAIVKRDNWTLDDLKELKMDTDSRFTIVNLERERLATEETPSDADAPSPPTSGEKKTDETTNTNDYYDGEKFPDNYVPRPAGQDAGYVSTQNAQDYFGRAVMVSVAEGDVPGIVQGVDAVSGSVRVMFKDGSLSVVGIDAVRLDEGVTPNKVGSQTLAGYMETPPQAGAGKQTPSDAGASSPTAQSDSTSPISGEKNIETPDPLIGKTVYVDTKAFKVLEVFKNGMVDTIHLDSGVGHGFHRRQLSLTPPVADGPFVEGAVVEAVTHGGVSHMGTIVSISGGLYTVSTSEGEMPFQAFQLTPYEIVNSTLDKVSGSDLLLDGQETIVKRTLNLINSLALELALREEMRVLSILIEATGHDVSHLAKMTDAEVESILVGYEERVAQVLVVAMGHVEGYTGKIREQVIKARKEGV